jgi:tetratricopeptide (TPR) repeat protein
LPKAPNGSNAVLFCIDAENDRLFKTAKSKLVDNFNTFVTEDTCFKAFYVSKKRLSRYELYKKSEALRLLEKTNCIFLVFVRYTADDIDNAETFELQINYGVRHPAFNELGKKILSHDMATLNIPARKHRFVKANTLDVFNFTTQSLVCGCHYIAGLVALLSGRYRLALKLLQHSKWIASTELQQIKDIDRLVNMIDDRVFLTQLELATEYINLFKDNKDLENLHMAREALRAANKIHPDTYRYSLDMAYVHIILEGEAAVAKKFIERCKIIKENTDWMYSDAFISAYFNQHPSTILSRYKKALSNPCTSLSEIVEYVEFVIEQRPDKIGLHLAAGLIYEEMGDTKLMKNHFAVYIENAKNLDQRSREKIESKMADAPCGMQCDHNCCDCASLTA